MEGHGLGFNGLEEDRERIIASLREKALGRDDNLASWVEENLDSYATFQYIVGDREFVADALLAHYLFSVLESSWEDIKGMGDPIIAREVGMMFYRSDHALREAADEARERGDSIEAAMWRGFIDASEDMLLYLKDATSEELFERVSAFLADWRVRMERLKELSGRDELRPEDAMEMSDILSSAGSADGAISILKGIGNSNDMDDVLYRLAVAEISRGRTREASSYADEMDDTHPEKDYVRGEIHYASSRPGEAYVSFRRYARAGNGNNIHEARERMKELEEVARENADARGLDPELYLEMDALYTSSLRALQDGDLDTAEEGLMELKGYMPDNPLVESQLAIVFILKAKFDEARKLLEDVVGRYPDYMPARRNLNSLDVIIEEYEKDPDYLRRLKEHLVSGRFSQENGR